MNDAFVADRDRLWGVAYRILASRADADDAVQDTWLRWQVADQDAILNPAAWLTTVTSRIALDRLRSRQRERAAYVGPWLPEPVLTEQANDPTELAESLTVGFLAMLERLEPTERVVLLLADVFGEPFRTIAEVTGKSETACRQIASRARARVRDEHRGGRRPIDAEECTRLVDAFTRAATTGDIDALAALLTPDVTLVSDGGSAQHAARHPVVGFPRVSRFLINISGRLLPGGDIQTAWVNGEPGIVVRYGGTVFATVSFEVDAGRIGRIYVMVNPAKLAGLG